MGVTAGCHCWDGCHYWVTVLGATTGMGVTAEVSLLGDTCGVSLHMRRGQEGQGEELITQMLGWMSLHCQRASPGLWAQGNEQHLPRGEGSSSRTASCSSKIWPFVSSNKCSDTSQSLPQSLWLLGEGGQQGAHGENDAAAQPRESWSQGLSFTVPDGVAKAWAG